MAIVVTLLTAWHIERLPDILDIELIALVAVAALILSGLIHFEVLKWIALGNSASQIADKLVLSVKSVETYRTRIMQKLNLHNRADLVHYALARGFLTTEE